VQGAHPDRREQIVAVREVPVGGGDGDAEAAADLGQGEVADPPLCYQLDGGVDQSRLEITVVVAAAFPLRWRS
jgi:hypothetical protein